MEDNNLLKTIKKLTRLGIECERVINKQGEYVNEINIKDDIFNVKEERYTVKLVFDKNCNKILQLYISRGPGIFNTNILELIRKLRTFLNFDRDNILFKYDSDYRTILNDILNLRTYLIINDVKTISEGKTSNILNIIINPGDLEQEIINSKIIKYFNFEIINNNSKEQKKQNKFFERILLDDKNSIVKNTLIQSIGFSRNKKQIILQIGKMRGNSFANLNYEFLDEIKNIQYYKNIYRDLIIFDTNDITSFLNNLSDILINFHMNGKEFLYK